MPEPLVCLCTFYDLKAMYGDGFRAHPEIEVLRPEEVADPGAVRYAMAFKPSAEMIAGFPNLRALLSIGAGVDGLLANPAVPEDIPVVRMVNPEQAQMMAGFAAYHVTAWHRQMWDYPEKQARKLWELGPATGPSQFPVLVLGMGRMGRACARGLREMGFPVTGWASRARTEDGFEVRAGQDALWEALAGARAVINVLPLTPQTEGLLDARFFARMHPDSILIQLGRGAHLNEADVRPALDNGAFACAALDVFATEPLPTDSPLWDHPKVRITPHAASDSTPEALAAAMVRAIAAFEAGDTPDGLVDRTRGY